MKPHDVPDMTGIVRGYYRHYAPFNDATPQHKQRHICELGMTATRGLRAIQNQLDARRALPVQMGDLMDLLADPSKFVATIDLNTLSSVRAALDELDALGIQCVSDWTEMSNCPAHVEVSQLREYADQLEAQLAPLLKLAKRKAG